MPLISLRRKIITICFFLLSFRLCVTPCSLLPLPGLSHSYMLAWLQCKSGFSVSFPSSLPSLRNVTLLRDCRAAIICRIYLAISCLVAYVIFFFVVSVCSLNILLLVNFRYIYTLAKDSRLKFAKEIHDLPIPLSSFVSHIHLSIQQFLSTVGVEWLIKKPNKVKYMYIIEYNTWYFTIQVLSHIISHCPCDILLRQMGKGNMSCKAFN